MTKVAMILTQDYEDSEATEPLKALKEKGYQVTIVSPKAGDKLKGKQGKAELNSGVSIEEADPSDFQALVIPGGHSPEQLRLAAGAIDFVKHFVDNDKPIAAICHGPQLLISARGVKGRKMTCYDSIVVDLENAGADYRDEPVVVDGQLVTSRKPDDLEHFNREMLKAFSKAHAAV